MAFPMAYDLSLPLVTPSDKARAIIQSGGRDGMGKLVLVKLRTRLCSPHLVKTIGLSVFRVGNCLTRALLVAYVPHSALDDGAV